MVSVTFQPYVGWREVGSRDEDGWLVCGLQQLREFVGYSVDQILLGVLVTFTTLYLLLIGEFVYSERSPDSGQGALVCDFFAGALYVTVLTRLLGVADTITDANQRVVAVLAYFVYTSTAVFVATLRTSQKAVDSNRGSQIRFMPKWVVLERILKGTLGIATVLCRHIPPINSQCDVRRIATSSRSSPAAQHWAPVPHTRPAPCALPAPKPLAPATTTTTVAQFDYVRDTGMDTFDSCLNGSDSYVQPEAEFDIGIRPDCTGAMGAEYLQCCTKKPDGSVAGIRLGGVVLISWAMLINLTHCFFLRRWETCSVTFVTRLRLGLLGLAFFGQVVTLLMMLLPWDGWFLVLSIGGGLALAGLIALAVYKICCAPPPEQENEEVKRDRIKKAHDKMLKKGYNKAPARHTGGERSVPPPPPGAGYPTT